MILNGHHRWAAALQSGVKKLPIQIVNLTLETDIRKMLGKAKHDRLAAMDLDEVVLRTSADELSEKALPFPFNRKYTQFLRLGIPALFHFLYLNGYDIWVYSRNYLSLDYLRGLFRLYHVHVDGIVTGMDRNASKDSKSTQTLKDMLAEKYGEILHIDNESILRTFDGSKEFEEYSLSGPDKEWSSRVMDIVGGLKKHE